MDECGGSIRPDAPTVCGLPATWVVCCDNDQCDAQRLKVCDRHEVEARALVVEWFNDGGICRVCGMRYRSVEHAASRWYRIPA